MKLIFSRKGFDSSLGKVPSPILPDGRLVHIPIPAKDSNIKYKDLWFGELNIGEIVNDLTMGKVLPPDGAHLDPDLNPGSIERQSGWRPLFGQAGAAQGHLRNQHIGPGDIFLFFGWFRKSKFVDGKHIWCNDSMGIHALFGWLQIENIIPIGTGTMPDWAAYHPHFQRPEPVQNDTVYISTEYLTLPNTGPTLFPGAGIFKHYSEKLRLTSAQGSRSIWQLPGWFYPRNGHFPLTYHSSPARWKREGENVILKTVGRGQEFVMDTNVYPESVTWFLDYLRFGTSQK